MAGVKISNLPAATVPLTGTELIAVVQGGATKQAAIGGTIPAAQIINTPTGTIAATNVQAAINEIVTDLSASSGSALVGFLQAGTGAVATNVQTKLRESVSVKDFGAVGDGVADDTAAIQAALDASTNVYFPQGNYSVGNLRWQVSDKRTVVIEGAGSAETTLTYTGTGKFLEAASLGRNCVDLSGFLITRTGAKGSTVAVSLAATEMSNFHDLYINNFSIGMEAGDETRAATEIYMDVISRNVFNDCTTGIWFGITSSGLLPCNKNVIRCNKFQTAGTTCVLLHAVSVNYAHIANTISDNDFENYTTAVDLYGNDNYLATNWYEADLTNSVLIRGGLYNTVVNLSHAGGGGAFTDSGTGTTVFSTRSETTKIPVSQLIFPATQNPSADANTLDDYQEGTFTPVLWFGSGNTGMTTSVASGRYTKIGNRVFFDAAITLTAKGSSTGNALFLNLPFGLNSATVSGATFSSYNNLATITGHVFAVANYAASGFTIKCDGAASTAVLTEANFTNTSAFSIFGHYDVA